MGRRLRPLNTLNLRFLNPYSVAMWGEYKQWCIDAGEFAQLKGKWRTLLSQKQKFLDLEIGTGIGDHFSHYVHHHPNRFLVGMELKYKQLIQTVKKTLSPQEAPKDLKFKMLRYNASYIDEIFDKDELDSVFIHFPDPWPKKRSAKHRLIQKDFVNSLYQVQRKGSLLELKTDSRDYFQAALSVFEASPYKVKELSWDWHKEELSPHYVFTKFEKIFHAKGYPVKRVLLQK